MSEHFFEVLWAVHTLRYHELWIPFAKHVVTERDTKWAQALRISEGLANGCRKPKRDWWAFVLQFLCVSHGLASVV
jgi:hypothetical protein